MARAQPAEVRAEERAPRRVAYLIWGRGLGGGELLLVHHLEQLDRRSFAPLVVATGEGRLAERVRELGVPVFLLPLHRERAVLGRLLPVPTTLLRLLRLLRRERVELIHSFTLETRNYANAAALLSRIPLIHSSQDTWFGDGFSAPQWWAMNHVPARVIATSERVMRNLRVGERLDARLAVKIPPGIDLARFAPAGSGAQVRAELGLPEHARLAGVVGRLNCEVKDFPTLFAAAERMMARCADLRLLVIGDAQLPADDAARVRALVAGTALERRVVFTGFRRDVPRLLSALDVLLCASPSESFGLSLAEAAACGRPVVSTRNGGAEEVVVDGVTGLLVPVGDPAALADAALSLLENPWRAAAMGWAARAHAERSFDLLRMVRRIEAEYAAVLEPGARRAQRMRPAAGRAAQVWTRS